MNKIREVIAYKHYFEEFLKSQPTKVQDKVFKIIEAIETLERIPSQYLKHLENTDGLYEARIKLGSNIWRVFCFFDKEKIGNSTEWDFRRKPKRHLRTKFQKHLN